MKSWKLLDNLNEEHKSLLGFGTALAVLLAVVIFFVTPLLEEAALARAKVVANEQKLLTYMRYSQQKDLEKLEKEQVKKLQALEIRLPKKINSEQIMEELYLTAEEHQIKVLSLKQLSIAKNKEHKFYLNCKGTYDNVLEFLRLLENEGSFKTVQEFVAKGDERNGMLVVSGMVVAYNN